MMQAFYRIVEEQTIHFVAWCVHLYWYSVRWQGFADSAGAVMTQSRDRWERINFTAPTIKAARFPPVQSPRRFNPSRLR